MEYSFDVQMKPENMRRFLLRHSYCRVTGILGLLVSLAALAYLIIEWGSLGSQERVLIGALACIFTVVNPILLCMRADKQVKGNPYYQKPITYTLAEEGIITSQGKEQVVTPWKNVKKLICMGTQAAVYTSSVHAFLFPYESMGDKKEAIVTYIKEHIA